MKHDIKHLLDLENSNALFPKELFANYDKAIEQISYYINTSNRVLNCVLKMKNEDGHGLDLETMRKIVSKYNGSMFIAQKTNEFIVDIELLD